MATVDGDQPGLKLIAVPSLITYFWRGITLAIIGTFQRSAASIDKSQKTCRRAKINIGVSHRKDCAIADHSKVVAHPFHICEISRRNNVIALEVCAEGKLANPVWSKSGVHP